MLELGVKFLLSYFVGSFLGSLILGRLRGVDIRTMGSGNAGGTNALRTQGWLFALGVMLIDVGKGAIGAGVIPAIELPLVGNDPAISREWLAFTCAAAAVVGHVWPIWHRFRGGKGAATLIGTLVVLGPWLVLPVLLVWGWILVLSGYVGLATMTAGVSAPLFVGFIRLPDEQPLFIYCATLALFLLFTHRSNIQRMLVGTEPRNRSLMLFSRGERQAIDDD
ncbi:MAG TPA: glycerol-3-phosphate acyltransferase [Woeseiaceae bacterium]|nr:glycerol-3-phosphate acyltransferase [Woeseiaceae bacterium]